MPAAASSDTRYVELQAVRTTPAVPDERLAPMWYVLLLSAVALVSGMANGYNGTVLEGTIPRLQYLGQVQDPFEMGLLEGALSLGGLLGSLICSELAFTMSRRVLVTFGEATIVVGVLCFAFIGPVGAFVQSFVGRTLTGMGIGVCGLAKPLIVSELAPPHQRGLLVAFFAVGQSIGMNLFYLADWALPPPSVSWAWRVLVAIGATPAFVVIILAFVFRESADYWDVPPQRKVTGSEGGGALRQLHRMLTSEASSVRSNFGIIIALMVGYNLSGTLIISNYASDILSDKTRRLPIIIGLVQLGGLISGATMADRIGRRPLLLGSCALTVIGLFSIGAVLGSTHVGGSAEAGLPALELWTLVGLMVTIEYAVGAGLNPVRIILSAELMPNRYRSLGMSLGNAAGWLLALLSLFLYPVISSSVGGPAPQFLFFGCVVAGLTLLLAYALPETRGIDFSDTASAVQTYSVPGEGGGAGSKA